jgi:choline dehydrogenase-like flavoprotein
MERYDYIIVGAGSAGCVLADRLSADGRSRVLVLEAGPSDMRLWIQVPLGYGRTFHDPDINWCYHSEPEPGLDGRSIYVPRGRVLGGSSSINAMIYMRGQPEDYAAWAAAGNPGWDWPQVLSAYRALEDHALGESDQHGTGGPLHIDDMGPILHPVARAFFAGGAELGLPYNPDFNGARRDGFGPFQITAKDGRRMSAARAFLRPAMRRANLRVVTGALATAVRFDGRKATGVAYTQGGAAHEAVADREVILAAGAINSPQLLQLSGIGPADVLRAIGIDVRHDLPGVGRNLQDHMSWDRVYRTTVPTLNDILYPFVGKARAALRYALRRSGPLATSINQAGGFVAVGGGSRPDVQIYFCPLTFETMQAGKRLVTQADPFSGLCFSVSPCRPTSRGEVAARSADPSVAPSIRIGGLTTDEDAATILAGARLVGRLAQTRAMSEIIAEQLKPAPQIGDDRLLDDIRARAYSIYHPCGTCRMGPDPNADVVDARLKVHGLQGLRVIDASIFPTITSANINAPAIMTGWRGADMILAESR